MFGLLETMLSSRIRTRLLTLEVTTAQGLSMLSHFLQEKGTDVIHVIHVKQIDNTKLWDFFDGAS